MSKTLELEQAYKMAEEILGEDEPNGAEQMMAAVLMLGSMHYGADVERLAGWAHPMQRDFIAQVATRLYLNGIWGEDGMVHAEWDDEEQGGLNFLLDLNVALGLMTRTTEETPDA